MHWITESPVVEGKVKVDTGTGVIRLRHPARTKKRLHSTMTSSEDVIENKGLVFMSLSLCLPESKEKT